MKYIEIPNDIVKYVKRKIIRCIGSFLFLEGMVVAISICSWEYFSTKTNLPFHICVLFFLCMVPFYVSQFPISLIDRSWNGETLEVLIKEERAVNHTSVGRGHSYVKHVIYLKVRKENGKEKYIAVREFGVRQHIGFPVPNEGDITKHLNEYSVGDQVYHFYGLRHCYVIKRNSEMIDCVVCGSQNQKDRSECLSCGHTLIKTEKTTEKT